MSKQRRGIRFDQCLAKNVNLMEREWSCYGGGQFNGGRMIVREVVSFMEGELSSYTGGHVNGGRMVMLQRWPV